MKKTDTAIKTDMSVIRDFQRSEITEHHIYSKLAAKEKKPANRKVLLSIANEEKRHYAYWKSVSGVDCPPRAFRVFFYVTISRLLGITFGIKLMERGENAAQIKYSALRKEFPGAAGIAKDEHDHEHKLISLIEEEKLSYVGAIVLGLNDALVELTGALAGLSFGFQNTRTIAFAGLVTGVAAGFSMAAAAYLSRSHDGESHPVRASVYTGGAYFITVALLILPYLIFTDYRICLAMTLSIAIIIIFLFNYYISVAKDYSFKKRFAEMAIISIGVTAITFGISMIIKQYFGIDM